MQTTLIADRPAAKPIDNAVGFPDLSDDDLGVCVQCGTCVDICPSYIATGHELDSPRGRIYLAKAAKEGRIWLDHSFLTHIFLCLSCRACETACASGIKFGRIIDATRAEALKARPDVLMPRIVHQLVFRHILPFPTRLRFLGRLLRTYQKWGIQSLVRKSGVLGMFGRLSAADKLLPALGDEFYPTLSGQVIPARGERTHRVGFVAGCVMPLVLGKTNRATVDVLTRNGCEVIIPGGQVCCGALSVHVGERESARELARRNIDAFETYEMDAIIINAAGCGSALKEYDLLLKDDSRYAERARVFASKVEDVNEFLAGIVTHGDLGKVNMRATYQHACHLMHGQGIENQPIEILRAIPGLELVEMKNAITAVAVLGSTT